MTHHGENVLVTRAAGFIGSHVTECLLALGKAKELLGYNPSTPFEDGIPRFVEWLKREAGPFKE